MPRVAAASIAAIAKPLLWEAKPTCPGRGCPGRDGRIERDLGTRIRHAETVRAQHAHPGGPADGEEVVDLGEARRQHDEGAHPLGGAGARGVDDHRRRHGEDGELDVVVDRGQRCDVIHEVQRPREAPGAQVARDLGPRRLRHADHRDGGRAQDVRDRRDARVALARLEALSRVARQRRRELEVHLPVGPLRGHREAGVVEHPEHAPVLRQDRRREGVDALGRGGMCEVGEQHRRDPVSMPGVGHREGDLRAVRRVAEERGVRDDAPLAQRDQRQPVVRRRGALGRPVEVHTRAEEAEPSRHLGQRREEVAQPRRVLDGGRPHVHGRAVAERDVSLDHRRHSRCDRRSRATRVGTTDANTWSEGMPTQPRVTDGAGMHTRIGINGFGRTGRATFRAAHEQGADLEWVGINDVMDIEMLAHLLRHDSVYGPFPGTSRCIDGAIRVDGREIPVFAETDPAVLPWGDVGAEVVIESTGPVPRPRRSGQAPGGGRAEGDHLRAGQGARRHRRAGDQLRGRLRPRVATTSSPTRRARPTAWRPSPRCSTRRSASATAC